ncbi:hypothetical protein D3C80_1946260 [compost metagenome]
MVRAETAGERGCADLGDAGTAIVVFEDLYDLAQRKVAGCTVEIDRTGQHGQVAQKHNQQIAHTAPAWSVRSRRDCLPSV